MLLAKLDDVWREGTSQEVILLPQTRRAELDGKFDVCFPPSCGASNPKRTRGLDFRDGYLLFFGISASRGDHDGFLFFLLETEASLELPALKTVIRFAD